MAILPPVEIAWGGSRRWPRNFKKNVRPWLRDAVDLARDFFQEEGVTYALPKTATVWCVGETFPDMALADGPTKFDVYLPYDAVRRRKVGRLFLPLVLTGVHELSHCIREEFYTEGTLVERVVSEGIACAAEKSMANALLSNVELLEVEHSFSARMQPGAEEQMLAMITADAAAERMHIEANGYDSEPQQLLHAKWFEADMYSIPAGTRLGIVAVQRKLEQGAGLADVITMPAAQIMGLPVAG